MNQQMYQLFSNLTENSSRISSIDIPSQLGLGKISQIKTPKGVILADYQMSYNADMNVHGLNNEEYLQIIFCMNEEISWEIKGKQKNITIEKGESCIYKGHGNHEYTCYQKQCDYQFKNIKIPWNYFNNILNEYLDINEVLVLDRKVRYAASKVNITPCMKKILSETKDFALYGRGVDSLFLEGKVMELISVYLTELLGLAVLSSQNFSVTKTDKDSISEAKNIIDSRITYAPNYEELAREVHMSTTKLSKGFSKMYGMPIHTYIINKRLEQAAYLLVETDLNICQIAALVGYGKPSNFSAAFKKKYGVMPKVFKTDNSRLEIYS